MNPGMKHYLIRPSAPLVFRSGKPFGAASRDGANFPWPSSIAGALRTLLWNQQNISREDLVTIPVAGPLLTLCQGGDITPLVPKPVDALYLIPENATKVSLYALKPGRFQKGTGANLPDGLHPMVMDEDTPIGKPQRGPAFWPFDTLLQWQRGNKPVFEELDKIKLPVTDVRTQTAIDRQTQVADEGRLFQIESLDMGPVKQASGFSDTELALYAWFGETLPDKTALTLGGERRLSWIETVPSDKLALPDEHAASMANAGSIVIHLATPAIFEQGWKPGWLDVNLTGTPPGCDGLILRLRAVALDRWQSISGWDLARNEPRAARKAVSAGSSYWFDIVEASANDWMEKLWLTPLSDDRQDRLNGFGLAIPGPGQSFDK